MGNKRITWFVGFSSCLTAYIYAGFGAGINSNFLMERWSNLSNSCRPWTYWWWPGSAVDKTNICQLLKIYSEAGLGGVHIIPIYGVRGYEDRYIKYLSPQWLQMLDFTVQEARKLGLDVDMTLGTGWCFGGPRVTDEEANALLVVWSNLVSPNVGVVHIPATNKPLAVVAVSKSGEVVDVRDKVDETGLLSWKPHQGEWTIYVLFSRPSGQKVKRAAPGGEGHMLNLLYRPAIENFLKWFDEAFAGYTGAKPRAVYHDSYEYKSDWSPDLLTQFASRYGYRLEMELPYFLSDADLDRVRRIKCDYRELVSDMIYSNIVVWVRWAHSNGFITRNEAHGSPGNILDFYAAVDIPETEFFRSDRDIMVAKLASSAAHILGRPFTSSESGTWIAEHFHETLDALKHLMDDFFLAGVNHIFYHGTCYSPLDAPWPGWLFYASTQMNPQNPIWFHVRALNDYIARCQAILQAGQPDNDILLYWPIYDLWSFPTGRLQHLTIHAAESWIVPTPCGYLARTLWRNGYSFDYISDRLLGVIQVGTLPGSVRTPSGIEYRVVIVPKTTYMPLGTLEKLLSLARGGAWVVFQDRLPADVPGWWNLNQRQAIFRGITNSLRFTVQDNFPGLVARVGRGSLIVGDPLAVLEALGVRQERMVPNLGLEFIRRRVNDTGVYFIVNRTAQDIDGWVPITVKGKTAIVMDPMTGSIGIGATRRGFNHELEVYLQIASGGSLVVSVTESEPKDLPRWKYYRLIGDPVPITGEWRIEFLRGGPTLPSAVTTNQLVSWSELPDPEAHRFAGAAKYTLSFSVNPATNSLWVLDLGKVCHSARVWLNGISVGTLIAVPFKTYLLPLGISTNTLEVEVVNLAANRIRDLDRRGVQWKIFRDINFVNINYRPFDASDWQLVESGLLGPVTLWPVEEFWPK